MLYSHGNNHTIDERSAVIIVDTGYSLESLQSAGSILAILDVKTGSVISGFPFLTWEHNAAVLEAFAGDPLNHGSMVLSALTSQAPDLPVILVKAYDDQHRLIRTKFHNGKIVRPGWTEAYLTAVHICRALGLASVANFSFGGYTHAADGTGWESYCLSTVTGPGKSGHVIVAGAGTGTGDAIHSSWRTETGTSTEVNAYQASSATYNFWCAADAASPQFNDWLFEVFLDGEKIAEEFGANLIPNLWNSKKQITVTVEGAGNVRLRTTRFHSSKCKRPNMLQLSGNILGHDTSSGGSPLLNYHCAKKPHLSLVKSSIDMYRFDCWIHQAQSNAKFLDHQDGMLVAEPAIFPHTLSVGLSKGYYSPDQNERGSKPDLLIEGDGPISFRLPEVAAQIAYMLAEDHTLDSEAVRIQLISQLAA